MFYLQIAADKENNMEFNELFDIQEDLERELRKNNQDFANHDKDELTDAQQVSNLSSLDAYKKQTKTNELYLSSFDNALSLMRIRKIKIAITELESRIAEAKQNLIDDEEWVLNPSLPPICRSEIYKDIADHKINIAFLENKLQKMQEELKELESLLGDNNARFR